MPKNNSFLITKPEIKFWLAIITLVVSGVICFTTLKMEVKAMYDKGTQLRKEYESTDVLLQELNNRTIRMEENQKHIMKAMEISVE